MLCLHRNRDCIELSVAPAGCLVQSLNLFRLLCVAVGVLCTKETLSGRYCFVWYLKHPVGLAPEKLSF